MAVAAVAQIVFIAWFFIFINHHPMPARAVGVNFGLLGDNLPSPDDVVSLYRSHGISKMRLFGPGRPNQLALQNSKIALSLGVVNNDIQSIAGDPAAAASWVAANISPYLSGNRYDYVTVGNEVIPGDIGPFVAPAMRNLDDALAAAGIDSVVVTTVVAATVLSDSYPPSAAKFADEAAADMAAVVSFLESRPPERRVLMANVYPYFACAADPNVTVEFATFQSPGIVFNDDGPGGGGRGYQNLFDAQLDAVHSALEKAGGGDVRVVVSETGWPSGGGDGKLTTPEVARTYMKNLVAHTGSSGTPKRPRMSIEVFVFALFNEDLKPAGVEQNFGLFYPDMKPVYPFTF